MRKLLLALCLLGSLTATRAQCRLDLTNYNLVLDESFDNLTHPSQLSSRWQFMPDDTLASFGGGEYYVDPNTNNYANLELRTEWVGGVSTKYLRLKAVEIQQGEPDYQKPIWNTFGNDGKARYRSAILITKRGVSAAPTAPFDLSDEPNNPNSASRGFLYGAFEIRMRLAANRAYPAFWLYGESTNPMPGPAYWQKGIQLNIFEGAEVNYRSDTNFMVGYDDEGQNGPPGRPQDHPGQNVMTTKHGNSLADDFHTYTGVWTPDQITFFFDGREIATFTGPANTTNFIRNIRNRPAEIITSLQMWPWFDRDTYMDIDYIRVYKSQSVQGNPYPAYKSTTEWMYSDMLKNSSSAVPAVTNYGAITLRNDASSPQVFYRGTDNYLYQATRQNGSWSAQQVPYNYPSVANSVLLKGDIGYSSLYNTVFFVGQDNRMQFFGYYNGWYHYFVDDNWNSSAELASAEPGSLVVTADGKLVYRGQNNRIHIFEYDTNSSHWSPSASLASSSLSYTRFSLVKGSVSVASNGQIFYTGQNNLIYSLARNAATNRYTLSAVRDPYAATVAVSAGPGMLLPIVTASGMIDVYYIDENSQLSVLHQTGVGSTNWQYEAIPYNYTGDDYPATSLAWDATNQRILYVGVDGRVQYLYQGAGGWEHDYIDTYREHDDFLAFPAGGQAPAALLAANDGSAVYYQAANGKLSSFAWGTCQITNPTSDFNNQATWLTLNRTATPLVQKVEQASDLALYPNPVATTLYLRLAVAGTITSSGKIYNELGQVVLRLESLDTTPEVDVSHLSSGLYYVVVQQGQHTYRTKFTKL